MQDWRKESLGLSIGDLIEWQDEALPGPGGVVVATGMTGRVVGLFDGAYLDFAPGLLLPRALVEFENGLRLIIDSRASFKKLTMKV